MDFDKIGAQLADARQRSVKLDEYPTDAPFGLDEAYQIQDAMTRSMSAPVVGWKVGLTSRASQDMMGVAEPMSGPLFEGSVFNDNAELKVSESDLRIVEAEICFRLGADLDTSAAEFTQSDILSAIASIHPMFELATKRLPGGMRETAPWIIADGGINQAIVVGEGTAFSPEIDVAMLKVKVDLNGTPVSEGIGSNAMGSPISVLVWLADHLKSRNISLKKGDFVATGLVCDMLIGQSGDRFSAHFDGIGSVAMRLT
ncbi:MAG: fumarylacetoacetate hydrolase family protein [Paracoccaceae bacterium]|nr:fumarylacetoacetate hydrolase family protein [Paracoccaceae bacterium]